ASSFGPRGPLPPTPWTTAPATHGWRLPAEMQPGWKSRPWPRRHWRPLLALGLIVTFVAAIVFVAAPLVRVELDLLTQSNGDISSLNIVTNNGRTTFEIYTSGVPNAAAGPAIACSIVRPILARDGYGDAHFLIIDRFGEVLADETTDCTGQPPSTPPNPTT
ncbi:MAG: hypothetical protein ACRDGQ_06915, partial [Candidatus Limnocylindrales bacterium]